MDDILDEFTMVLMKFADYDLKYPGHFETIKLQSPRYAEAAIQLRDWSAEIAISIEDNDVILKFVSAKTLKFICFNLGGMRPNEVNLETIREYYKQATTNHSLYFSDDWKNEL